MTPDNRAGRDAGTGQKLQLFSEIVACLTFLSTRLVSERCAPRGNLVGSVWRHFCFDALCIDNETALDSVRMKEGKEGRDEKENRRLLRVINVSGISFATNPGEQQRAHQLCGGCTTQLENYYKQSETINALWREKDVSATMPLPKHARNVNRRDAVFPRLKSIAGGFIKID